MNAEQKIRKALTDKGWEIRSYYYDRPAHYATGAEGGFEIDVVIDEYPELDAAEDGGLGLCAAYYKTFDRINTHLTERYFASDSREYAECSNGFIGALNLSNVLYAIGLLPHRLSIEPMIPHESPQS